MVALKLCLSIAIVLLYACNTKQEYKTTKPVALTSSFAPLQITVLADLPDSLQPKTVALNAVPKPVVINVPRSKGNAYMDTTFGEIKKIKLEPPITHPLPVLQNEKGEAILDKEGKPFIMGDGGKSNFTTFTTDNGLALDAITCSIMDKMGNLWFGTEGGGVSRYDGKSFTNFTTVQGLAFSVVLSITEDKTGNLWFGTQGGGVSRYNGRSFTTFTTTQGLASNYVNSITEDKAGDLWFGTGFSGGVSHYNGKSFTNFTSTQGLANNTVFGITEDSASNLWFGTASGVSRYDGKSFTNFTTTQGLPNNAVFSITEDKAGNLWFGTASGVSRYDGKSFTNFTTAQGLPDNVVGRITEDKAGNLWFGTRVGGVSRYDGKSFTNFTTAQGLASNFVRSITEDKAGNLWFGTAGNGVSRYNGKSCTNFTTAQGLASNFVCSVNEDKAGNLWFGTRVGGVSRYDGKSFTNFTTAQGLADNVVWSIIEDKIGNLWFGTAGGGVSRYDGKSFTNFNTTQGLIDVGVWSITEDKVGNLWFGTNGGVSRYDGKSFTNFTTVQGLVNNYVGCITEDKAGNLWIGTDSGVSRYDGKSFTNFTTAQGLPNNTVWSITEDKAGNLWFGTKEGLSVIRAQDVRSKNFQSATLFKTFKIEDGLPDNVVTIVMQLPDGKMAIGTNRGIGLFNISEDFTKLTDIELYNSNTGYPIKDVIFGQNCLLMDSKGFIWAGTGNEKTALVRFDRAALNINRTVPNLVIQSIKVKDENISWYDLSKDPFESDSLTTPANLTEEMGVFGKVLTEAERKRMQKRFGNIQFKGIRPFYAIPENLVLPYEHNQISFEFAVIETSRPQMVKYRYQLEGYDQDWSPVTSRTNASFGNIHEGTYTFKLKAQGTNGVWTKPITYSFRVFPPWYRSWWAYTIYGMLSLLGIYLLGRNQRQRILQQERRRTLEREVAQAKEIEKAYADLGLAHETLKSTQAQLIQSEKLASLGELTAGIAHEIQNPLNFVNNFAEVSEEMLVEMEAELDKGDMQEVKAITTDLKQNLSKINHHGQRASSIVKGMLEHSRASTGMKEPTDLNALADEYLRLAYHGLRAKDNNFNATMETHFDPDLPKVAVIPQDIGRVLLNLINNAFYAVAERSRSTVHQRDVVETLHATSLQHPPYQPTVTVSTQKTGDQIIIKVEDNGNGIPEAIRDKIFQPFFTTKPTGQGTGLGLSLAYDIVTKGHVGSVEVESTEGVGSAFILKLPFI